MADALFEDILVEILVRLPIKSLLQFRSVCKSWNSLITNPNFITKHVKHNLDRRNYNEMVRLTDRRTLKIAYSLRGQSKPLDFITELDPPSICSSRVFRTLGSVNGLVCLSDDFDPSTHLLQDHCRKSTIILWNPMIRKFLTVPMVQLDKSIELNCSIFVFGFGFDPSTEDYMVLRIDCVNKKFVIRVFRVSSCSWTTIDDINCSVPKLSPRQAYLNGFVHWLASEYHLIVGCNLNRLFDRKNEIFTEMTLHPATGSTAMNNMCVATWQGLLSVFEMQVTGDICLWVMKEYGVVESWSKQFVIETNGMLTSVRGIMSNGVVVIEYEFGRLMMFDPKMGQTKHLGFEFEGDARIFHMRSFIQSLVLLNTGEAQMIHGETGGSSSEGAGASGKKRKQGGDR